MFSINTQRNGNGYYTSQPQRYGYNHVNYEYPNYQNFPFSTFDTKSTQEKIKQSNKELELGDKVIGKKTYGIGFRYTQTGTPVEIGMRITEDEADKYLHVLVQNYVKGLQNSIKVPLTQNQFNAVVSFTYNLHNSDPKNISNNSLVKLLNSGDYIGVSKKFNEYIYSNSKKLQGLINRRNKESTLFKYNLIIFKDNSF